MAKKDKKRAAKQRQWETENKRILDFRANAKALKTLARSRGCTLRFFEFLDSYEDEFHAIVKEARDRFPSLVGVFEVDTDEYVCEEHGHYGIEASWEHVRFRSEDPLANTYNDPDPTSNINGKVFAFLKDDGLRTLVLIQKQVKCEFEHRENKYHFKLIALCHELGHVEDMEGGLNFEPIARKAKIVEAEVYAHLFALQEANRRGLFSVANTLETTLQKYVKEAEYRGEVARRVLASYSRPEQKTWQNYTAGKQTSAEQEMLRRLT